MPLMPFKAVLYILYSFIKKSEVANNTTIIVALFYHEESETGKRQFYGYQYYRKDQSHLVFKTSFTMFKQIFDDNDCH